MHNPLLILLKRCLNGVRKGSKCRAMRRSKWMEIIGCFSHFCLLSVECMSRCGKRADSGIVVAMPVEMNYGEPSHLKLIWLLWIVSEHFLVLPLNCLLLSPFYKCPSKTYKCKYTSDAGNLGKKCWRGKRTQQVKRLWKEKLMFSERYVLS